MSSSAFYFLIPLAVFAVVYVRASNKQKPEGKRIDFIAQASAHIHGIDEEEKVANTNTSSNIDYNYDVVGESFQRQHLLDLIKAHDAYSSGEINTTAILEPEPTNPFDKSAVKVLIEDQQVGYIAKEDSPNVTKMIKKSKKEKYEVPAQIGFDPNSPQPLIGVRIALIID